MHKLRLTGDDKQVTEYEIDESQVPQHDGSNPIDVPGLGKRAVWVTGKDRILNPSTNKFDTVVRGIDRGPYPD